MNNNELPLATDKECKDRRNWLIKNGIVKPLGEERNELEFVKKECKERRKLLINKGLITPK